MLSCLVTSGFAVICVGHFLSILNHTAPALILEGPGSRSKPANLFRSVKSLDMSES